MNPYQYHVAKLFLYDSAQSRETLYGVFEILHENGISDCFVQKHWATGPHIAVYFRDNDIDCDLRVKDTLITAFQDLLGEYEGAPVDHNKYEQLSSRLAKAERYTCELLPLRDDLSLEVTIQDLSSNQTIYAPSLYQKCEIEKSAFFIRHHDYLGRLSPDDREILSAKMMLITANQYRIEIEDTVLEGIKFGYISFKSHWEGFNMQLQRMTEEKRDIVMQKFDHTSKELQSFIDEIPVFLTQVEKRFKDYGGNDKAILLDWYAINESLGLFFHDGLVRGEIHFEEYHDISSFTTGGSQLSDFHSKFVDEEGFASFSKSIGFLQYRLLVNSLYSVFPLLNISPFQKNKLCKVISEHAEQHYNFSWEDIMAMRGDRYNGTDIYHNI